MSAFQSMSFPAVLFAALMSFYGGAGISQAAEPRYEIENIGRLPRTAQIIPRDINNDGTVVGTLFRYGGLGFTGFSYRDGQMTVLNKFPGAQRGFAEAVNDFGVAVGASYAPGLFFSHAVAYRDSLPYDLFTGTAFSGNQGHAAAINNAGMVAGLLYQDSMPSRPFLLNGTDVQVIDVPNVNNVRDVALNDAGDVLIYSMYAEQNYLWHDGVLTTLPKLGERTMYRGITNSGLLAGVGEVDGQTRAFLYEQGTIQLIDTPSIGEAYIALNEQGWVAGVLEGPDKRNFLYRDGQTLIFEDLLLPRGGARWSDLRIVGMNDVGQIIGEGTFHGPRGDFTRAFIANPVPEPATLALMLAGLGVIVTAQRAQRAAAERGRLAQPGLPT